MKPKKMRGGGMAGKKTIDTTKLGALPSKGPKRPTTGRSGPNTAKLAMGKKANAVKKAGARRAGGGMPVGMAKGGTDLATLRKMAKDKGYKLVKS